MFDKNDNIDDNNNTNENIIAVAEIKLNLTPPTNITNVIINPEIINDRNSTNVFTQSIQIKTKAQMIIKAIKIPYIVNLIIKNVSELIIVEGIITKLYKLVNC